MLLTITTTHRPATDLGFLLRKNPARVQSFDLTFGRANVFYPEATEERCTAALQVEVDPVGLVRNRRGPAGEGGALEQYVNDRPYAASSFLSVAIADVFGSALSGTSKERPELVETPLPLTVHIPALPCRGGEEFLRRIFEPLGYTVSAKRLPLDKRFPDWGDSAYHQVELSGTLPLRNLLAHLYVLVPVLDNDKHYWVGDAEVDKLLRHGEGWLSADSVSIASLTPADREQFNCVMGLGWIGDAKILVSSRPLQLSNAPSNVLLAFVTHPTTTSRSDVGSRRRHATQRFMRTARQLSFRLNSSGVWI